MKRLLLAGVAAVFLFGAPAHAQQPLSLLNASYDIARELFIAINEAFIPAHQQATGQEVTIDQSHAGTSRQARAISEGLSADVVTFNQVTDIDFLVQSGFVSEDWPSEFPNQASPFYSLPSFLVREGNPKGIEDWDDLVREDVQVVFPNPKTSGNARYTYLAAYAYALEAFEGDQTQAQDFVRSIFDNVPVFDMPLDAFDEVLRLNLHGTLVPSLVFGEAMVQQGKGSIINISSMASTQALSGVLGYSVAKAGIDNFTRWMASDVARQCGPEIRVNAVAPGFFISTQNRAVLVQADGTYTERARAVVAKTPMGRFGDPAELNGAIQWLCSDAASFVTGTVIPVDGGLGMGH